MAGNNSIQFLRGTSTARKASTQKLLPGQPFYEMDTQYLYMGGGDNKDLKDETPLNIQGPQGPQGLIGPTGPTGPQGSAATVDLPGFEIDFEVRNQLETDNYSVDVDYIDIHGKQIKKRLTIWGGDTESIYDIHELLNISFTDVWTIKPGNLDSKAAKRSGGIFTFSYVYDENQTTHGIEYNTKILNLNTGDTILESGYDTPSNLYICYLAGNRNFTPTFTIIGEG